MTRRHALQWIARHDRKAPTTKGVVTRYRPTTGLMRRLLHERTTPREVRVYLYDWLLYRRHACRR